MSVAPLRDMVDERTVMLPLTVDQYHDMMRAGIIVEGEPYELLDGYVFRKDRSAAGADPMTVNIEHAWVVQQLVSLNSKLLRLGCYMRIQQPVTLLPRSEPEPDGAIILGRPEDTRDRHPGPSEVLCIIEVADSSLPRDRGIKLGIYARGGIACYVIINLPDRVIEVYAEPLPASGRYGRSLTLTPRQRISFPAAGGKQLTIPARKLLPSA